MSLKAMLKMKEESHNYKYKEIEKIITSLKIQIEEDKIFEELLIS
jgi:hypothetical protein